MKILHRSILKELILAFILSLVSLNFILMTETLLRLSKILSGVGSSVFDIVKLIAYIQPPLLLFTVPMSLLLSTLLVYGRLNIDSETVIMRVSGMSFRDISIPVAVLGIVCYLLTTGVSMYIGPKSALKLREETAHIIQKRMPLAIEEGRFMTGFKDIIILVKEKPSETAMKGIFLYDMRNDQEPRMLMAREGVVSSQGNFIVNLLLKNGYINTVKGDSSTELFFDNYNFSLHLEPVSRAPKNREMTPYELIERIREKDQKELTSLCLELYRRVSLPLMCIILIFIGPPLAMVTGKSGKMGGLSIGLSVVTVYYMVLIYSENLAKAGKIPDYIGAWSATIMLAIAAFFMFRRERRR